MFSELLQQNGLSLDRLLTFYQVSEAGGVTRAAKGDPSRQSLFSRQIKELEQYFGVELMRRSGRGIALTADGKRLLAVIVEAFGVLTDFKNECLGQPCEITVAAGESLIQWLLLPRLGTTLREMPLVRFRFVNLSSSEAARQLTEGRIDCAIIRQDAVTSSVKYIPLGVVRYSYFVPIVLLSSRKITKPFKPSILSELPMATLEGNGSFRRELATICKKRGLALKIHVECSSFPLALSAMRNMCVASILPEIAGVDLAGLKIQEIKLDCLHNLDRSVCLAWNPRIAEIRGIVLNLVPVFEKIMKI